MAALITTERAKLNRSLRDLSDDSLDALILAASGMINSRYTIPETVPSEVEEACVRLVVFLSQDQSIFSRTIGEFTEMKRPSIPYIITLMLLVYKTPCAGPEVVHTDITEDEL